MSELDGKSLHGQELVVQKFVPRNKRKTTWKTNLYIKGFPESMKTQDVEQFIEKEFSSYGTITSKGRFFWWTNIKLHSCHFYWKNEYSLCLRCLREPRVLLESSDRIVRKRSWWRLLIVCWNCPVKGQQKTTAKRWIQQSQKWNQYLRQIAQTWNYRRAY